MGKKSLLLWWVGILSLLALGAFADTYIADLGFTTSQTVYTTNESIELKGSLYLSNYSTNGSLLANHSAFAGENIVVSLVNKNTSAVSASYTLNTSSTGEFYSQSDYYTTATLISAPATAATVGDYYIRTNYTDANSTDWWTQSEIQVVAETVDYLLISGDQVSYEPSESMTVTAEAIQKVGDRITYVANVSVNGTIRNSAKTTLSTFSCTTEANGKCTATTTAPSSYGDYYVEANNFKAFSTFEVIPFEVNIEMKDEMGKSIKHTFNTGEQASVEVGVITNSTSDTYTFSGEIKDSLGNIVKNISSTSLNYNGSYLNRFTFSLDALTFSAGTYLVEVNVTKTGGGVVGTLTSFEIRSWNLMFKKKEVGSGFEYEYSVFPNRTVNLDIYPTWRVNGSIVDDVNTTTSINISLMDSMNNELQTANSTWNASCGKEGCYTFSLTAPGNVGEYYVVVTLSYNGEVQDLRKKIWVIVASIFAQSTDKEGTIKELFGTNEYIYLSLSAKNTTATSVNLSDVSVAAVIYMNSTEYTYLESSNFNLVNASNSDLEWAWNSSSQRLKLDVPKAGGVYTVYVSAENGTAVTSTRFIVNPYDACLVAKNTAGQAGAATGYYYVYQFKTSDTVYFELKVTQANNPTGRASAFNATNSSYGMGSACADQSTTKQGVNNATVTIEKVVNTQTGKVFSLNVTESTCQADDEKGSYTCTIKPLSNWDGGSYGVQFKVTSQDGQTSDIVYGGFEARAFYLYAWSSTWWNKPDANVALNIYMYEAGNNWWGSYGSGGLSGTVEVKKVEYQGSEGEWLSTPIEYNYNVSALNTSTITNGQGSITLLVNNTPSGEWKTGYYRVILQGTDNAGNTDYGYAWFSIRRWEVYASPVECTGSSCTSTYNINSKNNISLYVTINNAGQWGQSGNSLGGNVVVSVKKINDCRKWPCTELNSSLYNATNVTVSTSSGWYWSGSINTNYLLNITPLTDSWGTGYWQVVLDVNGTETGSGWFNTIAFYVELMPTDVTGANWKYSIKNDQPMYFKATTVKSQKSGWYYTNYNESDYLNTTIDSSYLSKWDESTYQQVEYKYPTDFNISIVDGGTVINGTRVLNVTYNNGSWPSGYYWGELVLRNVDNETATGWIWFQVRPFRVETSASQYSIDNDVCINGTLNIYDPDWRVSTVQNGTHNITRVTERIWTGYGSSPTTYTNFTPTGTFNGTTTFTVCPNSARWGTGSWGNYHYLTLTVTDGNGNEENGWLSFRTVPFSISWGSIVGGTNVFKSSNIVVPVALTKASSGTSTSGNLSKIYQWRWDNYQSTREEYNFSVGSCDTRTTGVNSCLVSGTQNVTIYTPGGEGWKGGYNYLHAEWTEADNAASKVDDWSGIWFNGVDVYNGWWSNVDENGNWKYYFSLDGNLSIKLYVRDSSNNVATVNVTAVEYSTPSTSCWNDYCRTYNTATYSIVGQANNQISDNAIIRIVKPAGNWTKGYVYFTVTVSGASGSVVIKNGNVYVKDLTGPTVAVTSPATGASFNTSTFWANWTTSESATCYVTLVNFDTFNSWYCQNSWYNISTQSFCNSSAYSGGTYHYNYLSNNYRSWIKSGIWGWSSGSTGLVTGSLSHYYQFSTSDLTAQDYGMQVYCSDEDWNYGYGWAVFTVNTSNASAQENQTVQVNVTLSSPANEATQTTNPLFFNYTFQGSTAANCSLYGNWTGTWHANITSVGVSNGSLVFNQTLSNGTYLWNVYCINQTNSSNFDWGDSNYTFTLSTGSGTTSASNITNVTLLSPADNSNVTITPAFFNYSFSSPSLANCSLYGNWTGTWQVNITQTSVSNGTVNSFNQTLTNGTYLWNVYCVDFTNSSNFDWSDQNWTFINLGG